MKKLFSTITAMLLIAISHAQWSYVDVNSEPIRKSLGPVASDNNANTILTGQFETSITFGGLTVTNPTPHIGSYNTVFIAKMLANESFSWVNAIYPQEISNGTSIATVYGANTDAAGNIYITGSFYGKVKFGNIALSSTKNGSEFTRDLFVAKLSSSGSFNWAIKEGTSYSCDQELGRSVCTDNSGNVFVTGSIIQKVFKNPCGTCSPCVNAIYVVSYTSSGGKRWEKKFFNSQASVNDQNWGANTSGSDIRSDGSNVFVTGQIEGSVNFGTVTLNTGGNDISNVFLLKLNTSGATNFAKSVSGSHNTSYAVGDGLFIDGNNDVYLRGIFNSGTISFGGCSLTHDIFNAYLAKYSSLGNCLWAQTPGGISYGEVPHPNGNIAMFLRRGGGIFYDIVELAPSSGDHVDSTVGSEGSPSGSVGNYPSITRLPNGFIFTQMVFGTIQFGPLTISALGAEDLVLIRYTAAAPPIVRQGIILNEVSSPNIILYPNPANDEIKIRNDNNKILGNMTIYDMSGKMIYKRFVGNSQTTVDIKSLSRGVYYLRSDQLQATLKFVKQ